MRALIVALPMAMSSAASAADAPKTFLSHYNIGYLTVSDGLPHNFVDDIYRDSRGFLWIGLGGGGLSRYDGNEFINFSITSAEHPLPGNFAVEIGEDKFERLWVATEGGLCVYNLYTLSPEPVADSTGKLADVLHQPVWAVTVDAEGKVWTRTWHSVICIAFGADGSVTGVTEAAGLKHPTGPVALRDVYGNGRIWTSVNGEISELVADFAADSVSVTPVAECLRFGEDTTVSDIVL